MDDYKILKILGDGTYGIVYQAVNNHTGDIVAIKKMKDQFHSWDEYINLREIQALKKLSHPNIIKLRDIVQTNDELYLIFDYMEQNLLEFYQEFESKNINIPEKTIKYIIFQIANGLYEMHKHKLYHRDLKPENILIDKQENVKLCDLGLVKNFDDVLFSEYIATRWYRAPELLLRASSYGSEIDIFALGCIMAELYLLGPLFAGDTEIDHLNKICEVLGSPTEDIWSEGIELAEMMNFRFPYNKHEIDLRLIIVSANDDGIDLLKSMLKWNPKDRITIEQILQHTYLAEYITVKQVSTASYYKVAKKNQSTSTPDTSYYYHHPRDITPKLLVDHDKQQIPIYRIRRPIKEKSHQQQHEEILHNIDINSSLLLSNQEKSLKIVQIMDFFHPPLAEKTIHQNGLVNRDSGHINRDSKDIKNSTTTNNKIESFSTLTVNNSPRSNRSIYFKASPKKITSRFCSMLNNSHFDLINQSLGLEYTKRNKSTDYEDFPLISPDLPVNKKSALLNTTAVGQIQYPAIGTGNEDRLTKAFMPKLNTQKFRNNNNNNMNNSLIIKDNNSSIIKDNKSHRITPPPLTLLSYGIAKCTNHSHSENPDSMKRMSFMNKGQDYSESPRTVRKKKKNRQVIEPNSTNFLEYVKLAHDRIPSLMNWNKKSDEKSSTNHDIIKKMKIKMKEIASKNLKFSNSHKEKFPVIWSTNKTLIDFNSIDNNTNNTLNENVKNSRKYS